ncbi:hypothetical protein, unlikely [Trypanosoma brucei gambiense DAL972]|uniref:Uncharacterized protein n=1 Tax=Trypanosoma brucei gambiense (strain MHOM/CI/86/DAL972) TaxID=679716 RepID=C9ZNF2_TRYB9|nr:hypothetical protein, unlikely [Trypanosoma brucei gambiense DAL972]CBH10930.1 hypothetical protein, unlikely [Trypanosoma brucei gambiense DAL972]|eukprot:XP_011773217.1 hypothetical protein, unlikely [Trypanosoma brucei gambiense DAL972]
MGAVGVDSQEILRVCGKAQRGAKRGECSRLHCELAAGQKQRCAVYKNSFVMLTAEKAPTRILLEGLQRKVAETPIKQACPMEMWELDMISDTMELERERVAMRLALVAASC